MARKGLPVSPRRRGQPRRREDSKQDRNPLPGEKKKVKSTVGRRVRKRKSKHYPQGRRGGTEFRIKWGLQGDSAKVDIVTREV